MRRRKRAREKRRRSRRLHRIISLKKSKKMKKKKLPRSFSTLSVKKDPRKEPKTSKQERLSMRNSDSTMQTLKKSRSSTTRRMVSISTISRTRRSTSLPGSNGSRPGCKSAERRELSLTLTRRWLNLKQRDQNLPRSWTSSRARTTHSHWLVESGFLIPRTISRKWTGLRPTSEGIQLGSDTMKIGKTIP